MIGEGSTNLNHFIGALSGRVNIDCGCTLKMYQERDNGGQLLYTHTDAIFRIAKTKNYNDQVSSVSCSCSLEEEEEIMEPGE